MENQKTGSDPIKPRWIFLGSIVIYVIYFAVLIPALSDESIITAGFGIAGGLFLIWGIVSAVKQRRL